MINAELNHNPYLLQTSVTFNGQAPRVNSQIEKYEDITLKDWIEKVPQIFYDEMNGYDFDLNFTGTVSDFEALREVFACAGISQELVRLFHKNELEDAETKSVAIDVLLQWLRDNPNRKFDFQQFFRQNFELFEGAYPYIIINGHGVENVHPQVSPETIDNADKLQNTLLVHTPILFVVDPSSTKEFRENLKYILKRKDVQQNQLFFMIHPQLNAEQVERVIVDLGVERPQIVSAYDAEPVLKYIRNYPITEFVREAIRAFENVIQDIRPVLDAENKKSEIQNAEVHAVIDEIEKQLASLKEADMFFAERDNFSAGDIFDVLLNNLKDQIGKWRNRKTKIVGEAECAIAAAEYDADIARYVTAFSSATKDAYQNKAEEVHNSFINRYQLQGLDLDFDPTEVALESATECQAISLSDELISMMEITYEEAKYDLISLFRFSAPNEEKEPVRVATCYYAQWRMYVLDRVLPMVEKLVENNVQKLCDYYNALAEAFRAHLAILIAEQEEKKDKVSLQLSDDERKLQEDNDWIAEFKEQLIQIERG